MCNRLQTLQNRAARVVTSSSYDRRSVEILDELGWDNLETRRTRQLATITYKLKNHIALDHWAQIFNGTNSMYSYNLRNSKYNLFVPRLYCILRLKKKTASTIEGRFSGIVYQTLLRLEAWSYFSCICNFRTILITTLI